MLLNNIIKNWSVSKKITSLVTTASIVVGIAVGASVAYLGTDNLRNLAQEDMRQMTVTASKNLEGYLNSIKEDLTSNANSPLTAQIIREFNEGWNNIETNPQKHLTKYYIDENPNKIGEKNNLNFAADNTYYSDVHRAYHQHFLSQKDSKGYYDIFLFNTQGDLIYSVFKESDFATNMITGKWKDTDLAAVFKEVKTAKQPGYVSFKDFAPYGPSADAPASFIASPVFDHRNQFVGVLAYQMPVDRFNKLFEMDVKHMTSYLVGQDGILRSDNPFTKENDILSTQARIANLGDFAGKIIHEKPGIGFKNANYAVEEISFLGNKWFSVIEMNSDFINSRASMMQYISLGISIALSIIMSVLGLLLTRLISRPLQSLSETVQQVAKGYAVNIPFRDHHDEIGSLSRSLTAIYDKSVASQRVEAAVDDSRSSMMLTDNNGKIIYNNKTVFKKLDASREFIKHNMQNINIDDLTQSYIYNFHGERAQELKEKLSSLTENYISELQFDGRYFDSVIRPVQDKSGNPIGFVSEWREKTGEVIAKQEEDRIKANEEAIEAQISDVIQSAASGDFKTKLNVDENDRPFIKSVSRGINEICSAVDTFFGELNQTVGSFSQGDLTKTLSGHYSGQFDDVKTNLNDSFKRLSETIQQITVVGNGIRSASTDITQGADDLSGRTEAQAASIEETVATMEEISASVRNNANSATEASALASDALSQAEEGSRVVSQAVTAMGSLENSSHRIAEIVSVIDSIASQTNLLALNAAVEAARAGEAGKGFAVVASEVRTLASRCSDAARDIRGLITGSNAQVVDGVKLVNATGEALKQIVTSVTEVSETIASISSASKEQATGVEEISGAISQMDEMTQQNAALSDESASAARSLSKEAEHLSQLIQHFRTEDSAQALSNLAEELQREKNTFNAPPEQTESKPLSFDDNDFNDFGAASGDDWSDL